MNVKPAKCCWNCKYSDQNFVGKRVTCAICPVVYDDSGVCDIEATTVCNLFERRDDESDQFGH